MKGPHFCTLHEKFEELNAANEGWFDAIPKCLFASGHKSAFTTKELIGYSLLSEDQADKHLPAEKIVENIMDDYRNTRDFVIHAVDSVADEGDALLENTVVGYKDHLDKIIWILQAFLGKEALEDDPAYVDDDDWKD